MFKWFRRKKKPEGFKCGDIVRLKHENRWKGTLRADNEYVVYYRSDADNILLRCDNRTSSYFPASFFELASNPIHKGTANTWSDSWQQQRHWRIIKLQERSRARREQIAACHDRAREYEDAILGQKLLYG